MVLTTAVRGGVRRLGGGVPAGSKALTFDEAQRSKEKLLYHGN
jgi:hypothetical protein